MKHIELDLLFKGISNPTEKDIEITRNTFVKLDNLQKKGAYNVSTLKSLVKNIENQQLQKIKERNDNKVIKIRTDVPRDVELDSRIKSRGIEL